MTRAKNHEHCPLCNSTRTEIRHDRSRRFRYLKKDWVLDGLEHSVCLECGVSFNAPGQIARNNERFAEFEASVIKGIAPRQIAALREKYMISQEEAARIFHTGKTAFSKWERGEVAPTGPTALLLKLALADDSVMRRLADDAKVAISATVEQKARTVVVVKQFAEITKALHAMDNMVIMEMVTNDLADKQFQRIADEMPVGSFAGMDPATWLEPASRNPPQWTVQ